MKKIVFLLQCIILSAVFSGCVTTGSIPSEEMKYEEVIDVKGESQSELYIKTNSWFVGQFVSAESVIEFEDKENGKVIGKYVQHLWAGMYKYSVRQIISIDIRNEKIRIKISDPYYSIIGSLFSSQVSAPVYQQLNNRDVLVLAKIDWELTAKSLKEYLSVSDTW